jgi:uncharacterized membrane protein (UPF0127 family)
MKEALYFTLGIALIGWSFYAFLQKPAPKHYQQQATESALSTFIRIGDRKIFVEVADTNEERIQGLSGQASLEPNHGLLFKFDEVGNHGFWMYDMHFPIDIIWIDSSLKVVGVKSMVNPDSYPEIFYPPVPVKYVLEINSNEARRLGIDTGTRLYLDTEN